MAGGVRAWHGPMGTASSAARQDGGHGLCPLPEQGVLSAATEGVPVLRSPCSRSPGPPGLSRCCYRP